MLSHLTNHLEDLLHRINRRPTRRLEASESFGDARRADPFAGLPQFSDRGDLLQLAGWHTRYLRRKLSPEQRAAIDEHLLCHDFDAEKWDAKTLALEEALCDAILGDKNHVVWPDGGTVSKRMTKVEIADSLGLGTTDVADAAQEHERDQEI